MAESQTPNAGTAEPKAPVIPAGGEQPSSAPESKPAPTVLADAGGGDGTPPLEPKPKEPAAPVVPEKYDLKLPDGSLLDAKAVEGIASFAKEQGLSQAQAEKLLMREHEAIARFVEGQNESLSKANEKWIAQVHADPEIGGEALPKNIELAKRVIGTFGSEAFKKELTETGLGNHPELVRFCTRVGKAMANDQFVAPGSGVSGKKDLAEVFYGKGEVAN